MYKESLFFKSLSLLVALTTLSWSVPVHADNLPADPQTVAGSTTYEVSADGLTGTLNAPGVSIVDWAGGFNIGGGHTFNANIGQAHLSRDITMNPSQIFGAFNVNGGKFFLVNKNGIFFAPGAQVNASGLIASTLDINNQDFLNGNYKFFQSGDPASILNQGNINAGQYGAAFLGGSVENQGIITATESTAVLASGEEMTLNLDGQGLVQVQVDRGIAKKVKKLDGTEAQDGVLNTGVIRADGGKVVMTAEATDDIFASLVNNRGIVEAKSIGSRNGSIELSSKVSNGVVQNSGKLIATGTGAGEKGGSVTVEGQLVGIAVGTDINVSGDAGGGSVKIGGDYQGLGSLRNSDITYIDADATIQADALYSGDGGRVIVWSDSTTVAYGDILARGGVAGGNGGFAEVSGKQNLDFDMNVDLSAAYGEYGTLLLDPTSMAIADSASTSSGSPFQLNAQLGAGDFQILAGHANAGSNRITWGKLKSLGAAAAIILEASGLITFENITGAAGGAITSNNLATLDLTTGSLTVRSTGDDIVFADANDVIRTSGGEILFESLGGELDLGGFNTTNAGGNGAVTLNSISNISFTSINAGTGTVSINVDTNDNSSNSLTAGAITSGNLSVNGTSGNDDFTFDGVVSASGDVLINNADDTNFNADVAGKSITVQNVDDVNVASNVDFTATNGAVSANSGVNNINLTGSNGSTNIIQTIGDFLINLANINDTNNPNLTISSGGGVNLAGLTNLGTGNVTVTADSNDNGAETLAVNGVISGASNLTLQGGGATGSGEIIDINSDVTAGTLNIQKAATVDLAQNVDLTASNGALNVNSNVGGILLSGAAGTNIIDGNGNNAVNLAPITATNSPNLTVNSEGDINASSININNGTLNLNVDNNSNSTSTGTFGALTSGTLNVTGTSNDTQNLNGAVNANGPVTISGGVININNTVNTTGAGNLTVTNAGLLTIAPGATLTLNGDFLQNGAGAVSIAADIITLASDITFNSAVTLAANVLLNSSADNGNITFNSTVDGNKDLTLSSGTGNIWFKAGVGLGTRLANLVIQTVNNLTFDASVKAGSVTQLAGTGTSFFKGDIDTNAPAGINLTGNIFTIGDASSDLVKTTNGGPLYINNSGLLTINSTLMLSGQFTQAGSGPVNFNSDLVTPGFDIEFAGAVTLMGARLFNAGTNSIVFGSTLSTNGDLMLIADEIDFGGNVSASAAGVDLLLQPFTSDLDINLAGVSPTSALDLTLTELNFIQNGFNSITIGSAIGSGDITVNGPVTFRDATTIQSPLSGGSITVDGQITMNDGNAGTTEALTLIGSGETTYLNANIVTAGSAININDSVILQSDVILDATNGNAVPAGANITITGKLDGTSDSAEDIEFRAGTAGDITLGSAVGSLTRVGHLVVRNVRNWISNGITANRITQLGSTAGTTTFNGKLDTNSSFGTSLTGQAFDFNINAGVKATNNGGVTIVNTGALTIDSTADMDLDGAFAQSGGGAVTTGGDIKTTADNISFANGVTLSDNVSLDSNGGDITFSSTLTNGGGVAKDLTLAAGLGNISFVGVVGGARIGNLLIKNANDVTAASSVTATSVKQEAGTGTTTFSGALDTNSSAGIDITGNNVTVNNTVTTTNNGGFKVTNAGTLTTNSSAAMSLDGNFEQVSAGPLSAVTLGSNITTTSDNISFEGPVTLSSSNPSIALNTGAGLGDIVFHNDVTGNENLTLVAGAGDIVFGGVMGSAVSRIADLLITSVNNWTAKNIFAGSVTQSAGTGLTHFTGTVDTNTSTAANGIDLTGNQFIFDQAVTTANNGGVEITNAGLLTLNSQANFTLNGDFIQNGAGDVSLGSDITTLASDVNFSSDITLLESSTIDTSADNGNVTFQGTVNGSSFANQNLTVRAGSGDVAFQENVGTTTPILILDVAGDEISVRDVVTAGPQRYAGSMTTLNGSLTNLTAGEIDLISNVTLTTDVEIETAGSSTADDVTIAGTVAGGNNHLKVVTGLGDIDLQSSASGLSSIDLSGTNVNVNAVTTAGSQKYTGVTTLNGNLTSTVAGAITVDGEAHVATGPITVDTAGAEADDITFTNTIDGAQDLTLTAGPAGDVFIGGSVGHGPATPLTSLTINAQEIDLKSVKTTGAQSYTGAIGLNGDLESLTTGSISLTGPVTLEGASSIYTHGATDADDILFSSTIDGPFDLTLRTTGAGDIVFGGAVGASNRIGDLVILNAHDVTAGNISAASILQSAGTGHTNITGNLFTTDSAGISLTSNDITIGTMGGGNTVVTLALGPLCVFNSGTFTLNSNIDGVSGGFKQLGSGPVVINVPVINLDGDIIFNGFVTLSDDLDLNAGAGNKIAFTGGAQLAGFDLSLTADEIDFTDGVGVDLLSSNLGGSDLLIQPYTTGQDINLGGLADTGALDLTAADILQIAHSASNFASVTIGSAIGSGAMSFNSATSWFDPMTFRMPEAGGSFDVNAAINGLENATLTFFGSGNTMFLGADILTAGLAINIVDSVVLTTDVVLSTIVGAPAGAGITITGKIDGTSDGAEDIEFRAGTAGDILLGSAVGFGTRVGHLLVSNVNLWTSNGITAGRITQTTSTAGTTTFNGKLDTNASQGISLTGQAFDFNINAGVKTTNNGGVTIVNTGALTIDSTADMDLDGAFSQSGGGAVTTGGDIKTTSDNISFANNVTLSNDASFDSTGGNITFSGTVNSSAGIAKNLTVASGLGNILFTGAVGTGTRVGNLLIKNAENVTFTGDVTANSIIQQAGTGTTTFNEDVDTNNNAGIDLTGNNFTFGNNVNTDTVTTTDEGGVKITNSGTLTVNANSVFNLDGHFTQVNGGPVSLVNLAGDVTTTNDNITFGSDVVLTNTGGNTVALNTGAGLGDITFQRSLSSNGVVTSDLSLTAGTGSILFNGPVGSSRLDDLVIVSANDVTFNDNVTVDSLTQTAGAGHTLFNGPVDSNDAINLNGNDFTFKDSVTTNTGAGSVTITNAGILTIEEHADFNLNGAFLQDGAGEVWTGGDIVTSDDNVTFDGHVFVTSDLVINANGGDITFNNDLDDAVAGTHILTLNTDGGDISFLDDIGSNFLDAIGDNSPLRSIIILDADDVNFGNEAADRVVLTEDLIQLDGSGTTTFNGEVKVGRNAEIENNSIDFDNDGQIIANQGQGNVILTAQTGSIFGGDAEAEVTAKNLIMSAVTGIGTAGNHFLTKIENLEANVSAGALFLEDLIGGLTIGGISVMGGVHAVGGILILAHSPITINEDVSDTGGGNITLAALGNSAGDDVTINANVTSTGGNGNILITAGDDVTVDEGRVVTTTGTGNVGIHAGEDFTDAALNQDGNNAGDITLRDQSVVSTQDGNIVLHATNNVQVSTVDANSDVDGVRGDIDVLATEGAISESSLNETFNFRADQLDMVAKFGIGGFGNGGLDDLETDVNTINADSTFAGDIVITEVDGVTLNDIDTNNGHITIVTGGDTLATSVVSDSGVAGDHDIVLDVNNGNLSVGLVQSDDTVTLEALEGWIRELLNDDVADVIGTIVTLRAGAGGISTGSLTAPVGTEQGIEVQAATQFNASTTSDSDIFVESLGDLPLGAVNANEGDVRIKSDGDITDANAASNNVNADDLVLIAVETIGTALDKLETTLSDGVTLAELQAIVTGPTGGIFIANTGALNLSDIISFGASLSAPGTIDVSTGSPMTVVSKVISMLGGDITLSANGSDAADDLNLINEDTNGNGVLDLGEDFNGNGILDRGDVLAEGGDGDILLTAGDTITLDPGVIVSADGMGSVTLRAGEDFSDGIADQDGNAGGDVIMNADAPDGLRQSLILSEDGDINVDAADNVLLTFLNADSDSDGIRGDVTVTARAGQIVDNNDLLPGFPDQLNILGDELDLTAAQGIGVLNALEINANKLTVDGGLGDVNIVNQSGSPLEVDFANLSEDFLLVTNGDLTLGQVQAGSAYITAGGNIIDGNQHQLNLRTGKNSHIEAGGIIGQFFDAIEVDVNGDLEVIARGALEQVSVMLHGNITGNLIMNLTPGLVFLNNIARGGDPMEFLNNGFAQAFNLISFDKRLGYPYDLQKTYGMFTNAGWRAGLEKAFAPVIDTTAFDKEPAVVVNAREARRWIRVLRPTRPAVAPTPVVVPAPVPVAPEAVTPQPTPVVQPTVIPVVQPQPVAQPVTVQAVSQETVTPIEQPKLQPAVTPLPGTAGAPRLFQQSVEEGASEKTEKANWADQVRNMFKARREVEPKLQPLTPPTAGTRLFQQQVEEKPASEKADKEQN